MPVADPNVKVALVSAAVCLVLSVTSAYAFARMRFAGRDGTLTAMLSARMLVALLMGFASGLPLLLTGSVLQAWLKDGGVNLTDIGLFALVEVLLFVGILFLGLIYAWAKGDLDWVKKVKA